MTKREKDEMREERIHMEAIVDAYGPEEQAMGWFYYLQDKMQFPFEAECVKERRVSPLKLGERVKVTDMTSEDDCMSEMFVEINLLGRTFGVPLSQLRPVDADEETLEAVEDWHYWVEQGYIF